MKKITLLAALMIAAVTVSGQITPIWSINCGGSSMDVLNGGCYGLEGRYAFIGQSHSTNHDVPANHGAGDAWLFIKNADGSTFLSKTFDGSLDDHGVAIVQRADSLYSFVINTKSSGSSFFPANLGGYDIWLKTMTPDTVFSPGLHLGGSGNDYALDMKLTVNGGYVIAGLTYSPDFILNPNNGDGDGFVVRVSPTGTIVWMNTYSNSTYDAITKITCLPNGSFITAGNFLGGNHLHMQVFWLSSVGDFLESHTYYGDSNSYPLALAHINNDTIFVGGYTNCTSGSFYENSDTDAGFIIKFKSNTDPIAKKYFTGNGMEMVTDIIKYNDSLLLVTLVSTSDDGIFSGNHGSSDVYVALVDFDLNIRAIYPFGGTAMDGAYEFCQSAAFLNPANEVVIATISESNNGHLPGNYGMLDGWILRFNPADMLSGISTPGSDNISIYPNPASETIHVLLPDISECVIDLIGLDGKTLRSWQKCGNINKLGVDGISSGIYMLRIQHSGGTAVHKIMIR